MSNPKDGADETGNFFRTRRHSENLIFHNPNISGLRLAEPHAGEGVPGMRFEKNWKALI